MLRYLRITFVLQLLTMGRLVTTAVTNHNALRVGLKPQSLVVKIVLLFHTMAELVIRIASIAACLIQMKLDALMEQPLALMVVVELELVV